MNLNYHRNFKSRELKLAINSEKRYLKHPILNINEMKIKKLWFSRDTSPYHWNHHGDQWGGIINDQYVQIHVDDCIAIMVLMAIPSMSRLMDNAYFIG